MMSSSDMFQKIIDDIDATVGVDSREDGSIGLFHLLAAALDWCDDKNVDFNLTLEEVREHFLER